MKGTPPPKLVEHVTRLVIQLVESEHLRESIDTLKCQDLWQLNPARQEPAEFADERAIVAEIVTTLRQANSPMLSDQTILNRIIYRVVAPALWGELPDDAVEARAQEEIEKLLKFEAYRDVDVPILNLKVGEEPIEFGSVTFFQVTAADRDDSWWDHLPARAEKRVFVYGRVNSPGDLENSARYASEQVVEALLLLRAIGMPIDHDQVAQIGVLSEYSTTRHHPHRPHRPKQNLQLESDSPMVALLEPFKPPVRLSELIGDIDQDDLGALVALWEEHGLRPQQGNQMARKLLAGFRWIGEATKPDTSAAKFLKLAVAFELLVGGEASSDYLTAKGLTAALRERVAFLLADGLDERKEIHHQITDYYSTRSDLVHGRSDNVDNDELEGFIEIVRRTAWALLRNINELNSVDQLQKWVLEQRYS
jgi:hypothetical protein